MRKYFLLFIFIFLFLLSGIVYSKKNENNLKGLKIVLDAGHGGKDGGTSINGIYEKDINLSIILKLKEKLRQHGVDVLLTRSSDYDLSSPNAKRRKKSDFDNRINYINNSGADLYLSIHINYLDNSKYYGAQTFYVGDNEYLAKVIQEQFIIKLNSPMNIRKLDNSIYMYKKLSIPGVLIECGFFSNPNEFKLLINDTYQNRIVDCIIDGLINYY